jgi:hypothetical protein
MNPGETPPLPATCGIAFKEWEGVCEALARGRQALILRKGGIEEGPGGFVPEHPVFWLYPTRVHQAEQGLKPEAKGVENPGPADPTPDGMIALGALAVVELIGRVDREERLAELDGLHVWTAETVEKRFHYRRPGLWVLGVRVFRRDRPALVPVTAGHAGCKTWVPLETAPETAGLVPALDTRAFGERMERLRSVLGPEATP